MIPAGVTGAALICRVGAINLNHPRTAI